MTSDIGLRGVEVQTPAKDKKFRTKIVARYYTEAYEVACLSAVTAISVNKRLYLFYTVKSVIYFKAQNGPKCVWSTRPMSDHLHSSM